MHPQFIKHIKEYNEKVWTPIPILGTFYEIFMSGGIQTEMRKRIPKLAKIIIMEYFSTGIITTKDILFSRNKTDPD